MNLNNSDVMAISMIKSYIEAGPSQYDPIAELCEQSGLKESKLTQGFKFLFGFTIHQYRLMIAMEYANSLLEEGRTVKEVAIRLGYYNLGHFTRAFIKIYGVPPSTIKMK